MELMLSRLRLHPHNHFTAKSANRRRPSPGSIGAIKADWRPGECLNPVCPRGRKITSDRTNWSPDQRKGFRRLTSFARILPPLVPDLYRMIFAGSCPARVLACVGGGALGGFGSSRRVGPPCRAAAAPGKVERPTGRTTLTGAAGVWLPSVRDGMAHAGAGEGLPGVLGSRGGAPAAGG